MADIAFAAGGLLLLVSLGAALWSIWPKMHEPGVHRLFYGWISAADKKTFLKHHSRLGDPKVLKEELANRIYGKARWLRHMYRGIQVSLVCLMAGAVLTW